MRSELSQVLSSFAPGCDVDRIARFMREVFAKERADETRDYGTYVQEDFSAVRSTGAHRAVQDGAADRGSGDSSGRWSGADFPRWGLDLEGYRQLESSRVGLVAGEKYRLRSLIGLWGDGASTRLSI